MRFAGKAAIVTGASRGIGRATAERLAREGAQVLVNYHTNEEAAREVVSHLNAARPESAFAFRGDVGDAAAAKAMVAACIERFGRIDILVNNAGRAEVATILDMTDANWHETMRVNVDGMVYCTREVVPHMLDVGGGAIVNVSSIAALTGGVTSPAYAASKGAIISFTMKVARDLGPLGIRVNSVAPGITMTEMQQGLGPGRLGMGSQFNDEALKKMIPLGRMGRPEEIAAVIAFLCSDDASYVSGECVRVTGGR